MSAELGEILSGSFADVKEAGDCPEGDFIFTVTKQEQGNQANDKQTPFVQYSLNPTRVVAADEVEDSDLINIFPVRAKLWLSDSSLGVTKSILRETFRLDVDNPNADIAETLESAIGTEVRAIVEHQHAEGRDKPYINVKRFLRLPEDDE
jgi:hypothetical protein|tara:strand:+ start:126 stop:575 length:450 start_codon:yes stop_codon:yes gene_type:complete